MTAYFRLTIYLIEGDAASSPYSTAWIAGWLATGVLAAALWCAAALPPRRWFAFVRGSAGGGWSAAIAAVAIGVAAWAAGRATDWLWKPLRGPTFWSVHWLLRAAGLDTVCRPADYELGTAQFAVRIAPECSGYEGIGLIWIFLAAYLWLFRRRLKWPHALLLVPLATGLMWLANVVRLAGLVVFGTKVSADIALGGFHSQVGWLGFIAVALGMVVLTQRMRFFCRAPQAEAEASGIGDRELGQPGQPGRVGQLRQPDRTVAYLVPLLAMLAAAMVAAAVSGSSRIDWQYPARVVVTAAAIWWLWRGVLAPKSLSAAAGRGCWSVGAVVIGAIAFGLWMAVSVVVLGQSGSGTQGGNGPAATAAALGGAPPGWAAGWLIFRVLGAVVTAPVAEELAFRGYLVRRLISSRFETVSPQRVTWVSLVISSVLFGALHGRFWVAGTLAGMCYAWAVYRRGRLTDAMIAHATTNALLAAYVLATGDWALWA